MTAPSLISDVQADGSPEFSEGLNNRYNITMTWLLHQVAFSSMGARVFAGRLIPPPLTDKVGPLVELALLTRFESRNTTMTVMSSWKCLRTPRSIFFKSEYLISLFLAASSNAALTSLRALP